MLEMTAREKFLFDVQGFLVVPNLLTTEEVAHLNEAVDANADRIVEDRNANIMGSGSLAGSRKRRILEDLLVLPRPWCEPFRELLTHKRLIPYLNTMLGVGWKMDHSPVMFVAEQGAEGLFLHGATSRLPFPAAAYSYANGVMRCGLISVEIHLSPNAEGDGGFAAIPGSHKANFSMPVGVQRWEEDQEIVRNPACNAGDALIFNEATLHGTLPWRAKHQRRALLYRYSPGYLHYAGGYNLTTLPSWADELTPVQRAALEPAHYYSRPVVQDDAVTVGRATAGSTEVKADGGKKARATSASKLGSQGVTHELYKTASSTDRTK